MENIYTPLLFAERENLSEQGWCLFQNRELSSEILSVARLFGRPVCQYGEPLVGVLTPCELSTARRNTTSAIYGLGAFPPHTDMAHWPLPPRYLVMRARNIPANVPTLLIDSRKLKLDDQLQSLWRRTVWKVSKVRHPYLCSMFFEHHGITGLRWDTCTMSPYGNVAAQIVDTAYTAFQNLLDTNPIEIAWKSPHEILIVDNWRMLHSRSAVSKSCITRALERVLVAESGYD